MTPKDYNDNFHLMHLQESLNSAMEVVPVLLSYFKPKKVLDVGCGLGTWLNIFKQYNCDIIGIDGDYVEINDLVIEKGWFRSYDLNQKFNLDRKFDLVISLEVAEHIFPENAKTFIDSICLHGDIILFSAAIPGQEGTLHYNEQDNDYWVKLFSENDFECFDFLRHKIWNNKKISYWYRQNILIFVKKSKMHNPIYRLIIEQKREYQNSYVHPELFAYKCEKTKRLEKLINSPSALIKYYLKRLISKLK